MTKIKIDLFSDTNTDPTPAMRKAMCEAAVGNEVAGEDPTVNQLVENVCEILGKEAGMFMPSGTMCNGVAYRAWCQQPGDRIFLDAKAHTLLMTAGMIGGLVNATAIGLACERGIFSGEQLDNQIGDKSGYNTPAPRLVSIEQTTNLGGGAIWPLKLLNEVYQIAKHHQMAVHMDGARLFNASVATQIAPKEYCLYTDSVWVDFAKGLGAPMGSVLCGSKEFIRNAWYYKFQQGGTMHQAGILAAGCLYALKNNIERLVEDHANAKLLANLLSAHPKIKINVDSIETNIVIFTLFNSILTASQIVEKLLTQGIRLLAVDKNTLRAIIHMDISKQDIVLVSNTIQQIIDNDEHQNLANTSASQVENNPLNF